MQLEPLDWALVILFFAAALTIGAGVSRQAGRSASEFFLSGRHMPWWLLGFSMVATTFAADTPLLVTNIVRTNGVAGNWEWWSFLLTGMLTVFIYARLWRRSGVTTDIEFYELRYSGRPASFLRGFRALYLGVFFNIMIMANVTLAAMKIGQIMLGLSRLQTILIASVVTVIFSAMGGLRGVLLTDLLLFVVAMVGAFGAAWVAVDQVGGLGQLLTHSAVQEKMAFFPAWDTASPDGLNTLVTVLIMPLAVQWWSVWYPGAEPGGGGYIAQRMLAAKDERHATGATLLFNAAHYALRPWPWILVALSSLVVFPDLASLQSAFPQATTVDHDLAYPAMLTLLPTGLRGLVVASLIAAYMSTISTHLNWGSSYVVNDWWARFVRPAAGQKELVRVGRLSTVFMMLAAASIALWLESAYQGFKILLQIGAGTGLLFILRWFWWRINAYSELTAMVVSFLIAVWSEFYAPEAMPTWQKLVLGVAITTVAWLAVTWLTPPDNPTKLRSFCRLVHPGGPGWRRVTASMDVAESAQEGVAPTPSPAPILAGIRCMLVGCLAIYAALFATGCWLYGWYLPAATLSAVCLLASTYLATQWRTVVEGAEPRAEENASWTERGPT
jgi:Na+/proline symporter